MDYSGLLFWNVDTQVDFIENDGKLYVQDAEEIKPVLAQLTQFARDNQIRVVNTADYHQITSAEISSNPDFRKTFPPHCIAGTKGAEYIEETLPDNPVIIDWDKDIAVLQEFDDPERFRNIIIRKDDFDVFVGNPYTERILSILKPEMVFVYGVTTNVCVDKAVVGLLERDYNVYVVTDAIKELPQLPMPLDNWSRLGAHLIKASDLKRMISS